MTDTTRKMALGLSMATVGYHPACWRHPDVPAGGSMSFQHYAEMIRIAESGKLDMVFLADTAAARDLDNPAIARNREHHIVKHDPLILMSALAAVSRDVGLVSTMSTTYNEPFHIARRYASLDHVSNGRAGWNIVTSYSIDEARNFNRDEMPDGKYRYARAYEAVEVATGLWDSWDADAFPHDKETGVYADLSKMRYLDHQGEHFRVRGPLDVARSPQVRPVMVTAGDSESSRDMAARIADVLYAGQPNIESARAYYASVKGRMHKFGRQPDELKIMPGIMAFVGRTEAEAREKFDRLQGLIDPELGLSLITPIFGDMHGHDIDGPVPETVGASMFTYNDYSKGLLERVRRENLTIRQLYELIAEGYWHLGVIGTPEMVADRMEEWFTTGAADGFNILSPYMPGAARDFVDMVVPELQRRGLFRTRYEGRTFRENLGLRPIGPHRAVNGAA